MKRNKIDYLEASIDTPLHHYAYLASLPSPYVHDSKKDSMNNTLNMKLPEFDAHVMGSKKERMATLQKMAKTGCWEIQYASDGQPVSQSLSWSDEVFRIYGFQPQEVQPDVDFFYSHVHPDDVERMNEAILKGLEAKKAFNVEHRIVCKDGKVKHVNQQGEFVFTHDGLLIGLMGITQDITERKEHIQDIQQTKANLQNLLENTDTGYVLLNTRYEVLSFNERANELLSSGSDFQFEKGANYLEVLPPARKPVVLSMFEEIFNTKKKINYETNYPLKDGTEQWLKIRMFPILDQDHRVIGITIAGDDVTDQIKNIMEKEAVTANLVQRNKDLEQFAYIISHNLRAPIANLIGLSHLIPSLDPQDKQYHTYISGLHESALKLDEVVMDLNTILQVRKSMQDSKSQVNLDNLLSDISVSLAMQLEEEKAALLSDFSEAPVIFSIRPYLMSIFSNLITNSIKFSQPGVKPKIQISATKIGEQVRLRFQDNGRGIDLLKYGHNLFKLYKRFHLDVEGRGMGLYMIHSQIKTLGGNIEVKSSPNQGTTFTITLPNK